MTTTAAPATWKPDTGHAGEFVRKPSSFREFVKKGGKFEPESGRYHIYVSWACPWAHRTMAVRKLKGLEDAISFSVVHWHMGALGWPFEGEFADPLHPQFKHLRELYFHAQKDYDGRFTVPVLFDKKTETIVNNESSEIIRMLNSEFNQWAKNPTLDLYPEPLRAKIDEINAWVYDNINNGVYKCGFAKEQAAYDAAFDNLFRHLDKVEDILSQSRYLTGNQLTEADVRLWTTLIRFDPVYVVHFKCNQKTLEHGYPNTHAFMRDLYQTWDLKPTVFMDHIKGHYFVSHTHINPFGIVPKGPILDYDKPHGRDGKLGHAK